MMYIFDLNFNWMSISTGIILSANLQVPYVVQNTLKTTKSRVKMSFHT